MKLLYTVNSPYARKVRVLALEKQIDLDLDSMTLADESSPIHQHNPLGKVPALVLDNDEVLYDSRVIVEYLDLLPSDTRMIPENSDLKIQVRRWEALADGLCDAAVAVMLEQRRAPEQQVQTVLDRQLRKVTQGLTQLNKDLHKKKWCVNDTFSLADIALGASLGYVDLRFKDHRWDGKTWQEAFPNVAKHYGVLVKRPSFKQTMPQVQ